MLFRVESRRGVDRGNRVASIRGLEAPLGSYPSEVMTKMLFPTKVFSSGIPSPLLSPHLRILPEPSSLWLTVTT